MMAKPMKTLELHYPKFQFLIMMITMMMMMMITMMMMMMITMMMMMMVMTSDDYNY